MKKLLKIAVFVLLAFTSVNANAAGAYDGIWQVNQSPETFISFHENNGTGVAFILDGDELLLKLTVLGVLNGNTGIVSSLDNHSVRSISYKFIFTTLTTMSIEQLSCRELYTERPCDPNGTIINASKIF